MWSKVDFYEAVAQETLMQLTGNWREWTKFLKTASRLYKYEFMDQLMIYAQRPNATACAEYSLWNDKMNRYVRRGSKGIALLDERGGKLRLRYVFDVSDTGRRDNARTPWLWKLEEDFRMPVVAMLEQNYGADEKELEEKILTAARKLSEEYWENNREDFFRIVDDSFQQEYDEENMENMFIDAASASITYSVLDRCGLRTEQYLTEKDFLPVLEFRTIPAVMALGTAVSQCSQQILMQIGAVIRTAEIGLSEEGREKNDEHIDVHTERGLPDSQSETDHADREASRKIRKNAADLPERTASADIQSDALEGSVISASSGDSGNVRTAAGADDAGADADSGRDGGTEGPRADDLGRADEQLQSPGGRNPSGGAYIQLSLFPSEQEQIQRIDEEPDTDVSGSDCRQSPRFTPGLFYCSYQHFNDSSGFYQEKFPTYQL